MTAPVGFDFDAEFAQIRERLEEDAARRNDPPLVRLFDGNFNLRGECHQAHAATFTIKNNETGTASLELPEDYYLARWAVDADARDTTNIHITMDRDGYRWSGTVDSVSIVKTENGERRVRILAKHDYEHLKHILAWANPFLPAEFQFPKLWVLFGRSRWALKTTLLVNLIRLQGSLWMLPPNPLDPSGWFNFGQSTWGMVVKPDLTPDRSVAAIVHSRFKNMHDATKKIVEDAQLTWECRRYLEGDPAPWPGADLKHGCLVWDLVDKSGWSTGTSFGGSLWNGLVYEVANFIEGGRTQTYDEIPDPNMPDEAWEPGWLGSHPSTPSVIFREGEHTGIRSSEVTFMPATDVRVVGGGKSAYGVNEMISAAVQVAGDLTAMIPSAPPAGGALDAILRPLYSDVFLAFGTWEDHRRRQRLGDFHYWEKWAEGADSAYTLSWLLAMRTGLWQTREQVRARIEVADGLPWKIGENGKGHFFIGDRVGFTALGTPPGRVWVQQVTEIELSWDRNTAPTWMLQIGSPEPVDPIVKLFEEIQEMFGILTALGVT